MENELIKTLAEAIDSQAKKAKSTAYDTTAEVRRVEGDTVWVHIPGGVDETPVRKTISCSPGDSVQVRIANGRGFLVGNGTSPPTDDTVAYIAQETANVAVEDAARARTAADSAEASAIEAKSAANQAVSDAATAGRAASVAQTAAEAALETANTKKTVFVNEPTPPYHVGDLWVYNEVETDNLQTSDGDDLIIALGDIIEAVILGSTTVYVCTNARLTGSFDENDWKLAATDDSAVNELREWFWHDANGAHVLGDVSGYRNDITSTGMNIVDTSTETSVAAFGSSGATIGQTGGAHSVIDANGQRFYGGDGTTELANIGYGSAVGESGTTNSAYYTFGHRNQGPNGEMTVGSFSVAEGVFAQAEGYCSHAEGVGCEAIGKYSHAQNEHSIALSDSQTVLGKNNVEDANGTYAVIVGNGTAPNVSARSNALTVDWSGNVVAAGKVTGTNTVTEEGTSGDWTYRKWASGKAEAWGTLSASSAKFTATGSVYYRSLTSQAFPTSLFNAAPRVTATVEMANIGGTTVQNVTSSTFTVNVMSAVATSRALTIYVYAVGTWQ